MSLSDTSKLAQLLSEQNRETNDLKSNISPDDNNVSLSLFDNERPIIMSGLIVVSKYTYATDSFILDHPVYGSLDSATLALDGGYTTLTVTMPVSIPVSFMTVTTLYSTTF